MKIGLIFAKGTNEAFGYKNALPWGRNKEDMKHFADITKGQAVLMGRNTWESLPEAYRPLPDRTNLVMTRSRFQLPKGSFSDSSYSSVCSFDQAIAAAKIRRCEELWIIGGASLLESTQHHASIAIVTEIDTACTFDVHAPVLDKSWQLKDTRPASFEGIGQFGTTYRFHTYCR